MSCIIDSLMCCYKSHGRSDSNDDEPVKANLPETKDDVIALPAAQVMPSNSADNSSNECAPQGDPQTLDKSKEEFVSECGNHVTVEQVPSTDVELHDVNLTEAEMVQNADDGSDLVTAEHIAPASQEIIDEGMTNDVKHRSCEKDAYESDSLVDVVTQLQREVEIIARRSSKEMSSAEIGAEDNEANVCEADKEQYSKLLFLVERLESVADQLEQENDGVLSSGLVELRSAVLELSALHSSQ